MSAWPTIEYLAATGQLGPFNPPPVAKLSPQGMSVLCPIAGGLLDQAIRQIAAAAQKPAPKASDAPREPGESLGIVAPMDGRLGRFRCSPDAPEDN